jgi:hypothetical protein
MNSGLAILVCLLVIGPVVGWLSWKVYKAVAMEYVELWQEGRRRRLEREPAAAAGSAA